MPTQEDRLKVELGLGSTDEAATYTAGYRPLSAGDPIDIFCRKRSQSPSLPDADNNVSSCDHQLQSREVVPPTDHDLNDIITNLQKGGCKINDDSTCRRFSKKRSIKGGGNHLPRSQDHHQPRMRALVPNQQVILDRAPIPYDRTEHRIRSRRSHRGCNIGARYVLFVLDTSGSIGSSNFERMKTAVSNLSTLFCGDPKVAVVTFGDVLHIDFCFNCFDKYKAAEAIKYLQYRHGPRTRTGSAAQCVCDEVLTPDCGLPAEASCIDVVFITDGQSNTGPEICDTVSCIHKRVDSAGHKTVTHAIGIGGGIDKDELNCISNDNGLTHLHPYYEDNDNFHKYRDFEDFEGIRKLRAAILVQVLQGNDECSPRTETKTLHN